jgi:hypothetical protein
MSSGLLYDLIEMLNFLDQNLDKKKQKRHFHGSYVIINLFNFIDLVSPPWNI